MGLKIKLIDEWKSCHKFISVRINAIGGAIAFAYASMYDHLKENFPPKYMVALTAIVFIAGIAGRLVSQNSSEKEGES